jgi:hypothetical protein
MRSNETNDDFLNSIDNMDKLRDRYVNGHIRMQNSKGVASNSKGSSYLKFKFNTEPNSIHFKDQLNDIPMFMSTVWKMRTPQIILPILTGNLIINSTGCSLILFKKI